MKRQCPIQETCQEYSRDDNLPPNNDVRNKYVCQKWLDMTCVMGLELYRWFNGNYPACSTRSKK